MSNNQLKAGLVAVALMSVMLFSAVLPAAEALTPRDMGVFNDNHSTARFPGPQKICGDHFCDTNEWIHMKRALLAHQRTSTTCPELVEWMYCGQPMPQEKTSNSTK